jgi:hypothetical protein
MPQVSCTRGQELTACVRSVVLDGSTIDEGDAMTGSASTTTDTRTDRPADTERADLLEAVRLQRGFLRYAVRGLDDEQASRRTTVSELTLGGLVKHVSLVEQKWTEFVVDGPSVFGSFAEWTEADLAKRADDFRLLEGETLAGVLEDYERVASHTDELLGSLADLSVSHPLPEAPWFEQGARWSARRVFLHVIAETAQHCGHADIIREALDGQKTMG